MIVLIERFYSSAVCAFLGLLGAWLVIWPLSRRMGALPDAPRRVWYLFPSGLALLGLSAYCQQAASAHLGATLLIAAVVVLALAIAVVLERRRQR